MNQRSFGPDETKGHFYGDGSLPYVAGVSWPRSGHHLTKRLLSDLLGERFGYCEYYGPRTNPGLACCDTFPCAKAGRINFSKQHDFDGAASPADGTPFLIQVRAFLPSVVSHYELSLLRRKEDSPTAFRRFALERVDAYSAFVDKWVRPRRARCLVLPYERLAAEPPLALEDVLALFGVKIPAEERRAAAERAAAVSVAGRRWSRGARGVVASRNVVGFRHFDEALFGDLEDRVRPAEALVKLHLTATPHCN